MGHLTCSRTLLPSGAARLHALMNHFRSGSVWEGDATKHFSVKKNGFFSEKGGRHSVNEERQFSEEVRAMQ